MFQHPDITRVNRYGYVDPRDPAYIHPEGFCSECQDYTTNYNRHGECSDCGTELMKDPYDQLEYEDEHNKEMEESE